MDLFLSIVDRAKKGADCEEPMPGRQTKNSPSRGRSTSKSPMRPEEGQETWALAQV